MTDGNRVKSIRTSLNMTMEEFGLRLGVSRSAISNIEKGNRGVTEQMARGLCREFNVSESWLRTGQGEMFLCESADEQYKKASAAIACGTSDLDRIIRQTLIYYYGMDDDSKKALLKYIESIATLLPAKKSLVDKTPSSAQLLGLDSNKDVG